jgi:hypothetical protein
MITTISPATTRIKVVYTSGGNTVVEFYRYNSAWKTSSNMNPLDEEAVIDTLNGSYPTTTYTYEYVTNVAASVTSVTPAAVFSDVYESLQELETTAPFWAVKNSIVLTNEGYSFAVTVSGSLSICLSILYLGQYESEPQFKSFWATVSGNTISELAPIVEQSTELDFIDLLSATIDAISSSTAAA